MELIESRPCLGCEARDRHIVSLVSENKWLRESFCAEQKDLKIVMVKQANMRASRIEEAPFDKPDIRAKNRPYPAPSGDIFGLFKDPKEVVNVDGR